MKTITALFALTLCCVSVSFADAELFRLWPNGVPGFEERKDELEQVENGRIRNVHHPSITVFLPSKETATGAAVVICPGGGHRQLSFEKEGVEAARFLNRIGVAAFVLKYRLGREKDSPYEITKHALEDGQRAMRLVRSRVDRWGLDPDRIGIMGFSAGGEVVSLVAYGPHAGDPDAADPIDRRGCRPNFQILVYPGSVGIPDAIPSTAPPAFLLVANDDDDGARNISTLYRKLRSAGVPAELHIFARGGHGFGIGNRSELVSVREWPQRLADWMKDSQILNR